MDQIPLDSKGAIARSRTRYKGGRSIKNAHESGKPSGPSSEQFQQIKGHGLLTHRHASWSPSNPCDSHAAPIHTAQALKNVEGCRQRVKDAVSTPIDRNDTHDQDTPGADTSDIRQQKSPANFSPQNAREAYTSDVKVRSVTAPNSRRSVHDHAISSGEASKLQGATNVNAKERLQDVHSAVCQTPLRHTDHTRTKAPIELRSHEREGINALGRSRALPEKAHTHHAAGPIDFENSSASKGKLKTTTTTIQIPIEQHGSAKRPGFDAPISAVNAGERRVTVKYNQSTISVPITPSTTPLDIVRAASVQLSVVIKPNAAVLMESFRQLGLERPLRRYEHIRDVMNSWANDAQNALIIVPSPTGGRDDDLNFHCVSTSQPGGASVRIYHSQRPGSWEKRWITLRADGQVLAAKRDEMVNICHLSDFDIYVPTIRQISKRIRPPKKLTFAIKSQQKSSMFLSTENFVHFFSTHDKTLAAQWYKAVQEWRSWYLIHVMGEGQNEGQASQSLHGARGQRRPSASDAHDSGTFKRPAFTSGYELADPHEQYKADPLAIGSRLTKANSSNNKRNAERLPGPPAATDQKLSRDVNKTAPATHGQASGFAKSQPAQQIDSELFAATGLLGRTYTQRKKVHQESEGHLSKIEAPTLAIPTTINLGIKRVSSQRQKQRPLVDLTPQYDEPPQHRKSKGIQPEHVPEGGLIEVATSPEKAIPIPPVPTWQRQRHGSAESQSGVGRSEFPCGEDIAGNATNMRHLSTSPKEAPFTNGLLARNNASQGSRGHGRGVQTGDRHSETPMIDLAEDSEYAPGSLLASVERSGDRHRALVIQREKRKELNVAVGEGILEQ